MADIPSRDNSLAAYRMAARIAEEYALPYLLGSKSDYDQIEQHLRERLERSGAINKQWGFPPNLHKKW
jgi:hypothetical protein